MKKITIFQENNTNIELLDDDETALSEYTENMSAILTEPNVVILETSENNAILKPSKISNIIVEELEVKQKAKRGRPPKKKVEEPIVEDKETPEESGEDVITDAE